MSRRRIATEALATKVKDRLLARHVVLPRNTRLDAKTIYGESEWEQFSRPEKLAVGGIVAELVAAKQVPLIALGRNVKNHREYMVE